MNIKEIRDIGKTPISDDAPTGIDVSYEDHFEALTDEIKKLSSPTAEGITDWELVNSLGVQILRDESKSLVVACYISVSLLYTDGLNGFAVGIHIIRDLLDSWWDTMYPPKKRKKGRVNILNWWDSKLREQLDGRDTETWSADNRQQMLDDINGIDELLADKLEDGPILRPLVNIVSRLVDEEAPEPVAEEEPASEEEKPSQESTQAPQKQEPTQTTVPVSSLKANPAPKTAAETPPVATGNEDEDLSQGIGLLGRAATHLFQKDHVNPLPYQINRLVAWSDINGLPPATNGASMVPPPDESVVSLLKGLYQSKNWPDLLEAAESRVRQHLFWLELSYYSCTALEKTGATLAAQAVSNDTRLFIQRIPGLELLRFNNDLKFASAPARNWLSQAAAAPAVEQGTGDRRLETGGSGTEAAITADVAEAEKMCADSGIQAALSWLGKRKKRIGSFRLQCMYDIGFCRLLIKVDQQSLALAFAKKLLSVVDDYSLEQWEPELAVQALLAAYPCIEPHDDDAQAEQEKQLIVERIGRLAPDQMISLL